MYSDFVSDSKDYRIISLLNSAIIPTARVAFTDVNLQGKSRFWKVSIQDAERSMFIHIFSVRDLEKTLSEVKTKYAVFGIKMKPIILLAGENIEDLQYFYVCLTDKIYYKCHSFLSALDLVFKLFIVLNLSYPIESGFVWTFIQHFFYKIYSNKDKKHSVLSRFLNNFQNFCSNNPSK